MEKDKATKIVKQKLWKFGYSITDINIARKKLGALAPVGFDLMLNGDEQVRIKVGVADPNKPKDIQGLGKDFDVYAEVLDSTGETVEFNKMQDAKTIITSKSPYPIFGKKEKNK